MSHRSVYQLSRDVGVKCTCCGKTIRSMLRHDEVGGPKQLVTVERKSGTATIFLSHDEMPNKGDDTHAEMPGNGDDTHAEMSNKR